MIHDSEKIGFYYEVTQISPEGIVIARERVHNLMPNEGIKHVIQRCFLNATSQTWYIGAYTNSYTPLVTDTMANFVSSSNETSAYTAATRPAFTPVLSTDGLSVTNTGSEAEFTFNAQTTVTGLFISSQQAKSNTSGILLSAALLSTPKQMEIDGVLRVNAGFTFASA